ncbi:hypothetical protein [Fluviibacter phosphoraccumulans]|uniref:hypothetical protein n=1 Tax=Fluviibacter phosphoraccumulans TaxID=1751046 RepID=UPI0024E1EC6E|nr:hypothetical protein [Fluviibacter phosphoraccumulans]
MQQRLLPFVFAIATVSCASVRIESASGEVRIEQRWGVLGVFVDGAATSHVAEVRGLGIASTPMGWSAGFTRQNWASLGPDCRLVIWVSQPEHLVTIRRLADAKTGVCVVSPPSPEVP